MSDSDEKNYKEVWRWGIGGAICFLVVTWMMIQNKADRDFIREQYSDTVTAREKVEASFDKFGDNLAMQIEVDRQLKTEIKDGFQDMAREIDNLGDASRAQVGKMDELIKVIENNHQE